MKAIEAAARDIGVALGECGADPSSPLVGELSGTLAELADEPAPRRRRWSLSPMRRRRGPRPDAGPAGR